MGKCTHVENFMSVIGKCTHVENFMSERHLVCSRGYGPDGAKRNVGTIPTVGV